jgi:hypothetical protein
MGRSIIGQEKGTIKSIQFVSSGTSASSGSTTVDFTINAVNTDKTEVIKTGWSENDVSRELTSSTNLQVGFRHGSLTHYWRAGFTIVEYN